MATIFRAAAAYTGNATNHNLPLPTGSLVGDWIITAVENGDQTKSITMPGTQIYNATVGTSIAAISYQQLTLTEITNGYVTVGQSASAFLSGVVAGWSVAAGFDALGTVTTRASSITTLTALGTTSDGTQDIIVIGGEKSTSNTGGVTGVSPSTTQIGMALQSGSARPSMYMGIYNGSSATRTITESVASANGFGVQIGVTPVSSGPSDVATLSGTGTLSAISGPVAVSATATLGGTGTLSGSGSPVSTATLGGTGTLTAVVSLPVTVHVWNGTAEVNAVVTEYNGTTEIATTLAVT